MILLTGSSGFLGKEIMASLQKQRIGFVSVGRAESNIIQSDLSNKIPCLPPVEMVVHAAGKAHIVPKTDEDRKDFFKVNVTGTQNLLAALEHHQSLKKFVFVSSVAVYGLVEGINVDEDAPLMANEPYGKSKIDAEQLVADWCTKRKIDYYILRLPLIAGKNAPGNLGAMVKGIHSGRYLSIGKAAAKKSMILAEDLAHFIINIQGPSGVYNLTDGYHPSFSELENMIAQFYNKKQPMSLPAVIAKLLGVAGDLIGARFPVNSNKLRKITSTLTFDDTKARMYLYWRPREVLKAWEIE